MKKQTNKKAQIRIAESMAVVLVFFILLFFGYTFYIKQQQSQFSKDLKENSENMIIQIAQKAYFMPELQCSTGYKLVREGCLDEYKLAKFSEMMKDTTILSYYKDILDVTKIELYQVYPDLSGTGEPTLKSKLYDQTKLAGELGYESQEVVFMPVSIYNPVTKEYAFGYLHVTYFYRSYVN